MCPRSIGGFTLAVLLHISLGSAKAQEDGIYPLDGDSLGVGDPAPKLMVRQFVRGETIAEFERGKVYVIEFWKCGCPPCRAAIPHLNDLQKKYSEVVFLSVGVYTPTADNISYVKRTGDQMRYRVAVDEVSPGKDPYTCGAMVQTWLEPAGERGVPTAFVIDGNRRIAWIGHPMDLDEAKAGRPLHQVIAGTWDLKASAAKFAEARTGTRRRIEQLPKTEREAVQALHKRAGRVEVVIRGNTVTGVRFDPRRITDAMIADLVSELRKLKGLRDLNLCGADITDTGLKAIRELTKVTYLDISCTRVTDAGLAHLRGWTDLWVLDLRDTRVTDAGLKALKSMTHLQNVLLSGTRITGGELKHLKEIPELHVIDLSHTEITDVALRGLQGMEQLRGLKLSDTRITDAGLKKLKGITLGALWLKNTPVEGSGFKDLSDRIVFLQLSDTRVADAGLAELKQFPALTQLMLDGTQVTDAGLARLRGNRKLRSLSLTDTRVTDAGLPSLRDMKSLQSLQLRGTRVTNSGLRELERFKALNFLDVARTGVTKAGVDGLRAALPNLQVAY